MIKIRRDSFEGERVKIKRKGVKTRKINISVEKANRKTDRMNI